MLRSALHALLLLGSSALAAPAAEEADEEAAWAEAEATLRALDVNEGELRFVSPPERPVHHHDNRILLDEESLASGWARLEQCHRHLDPVHATQIVYRPDRIRNLRVTEARHIAEARIEGPSVQLTDVARDASLCVSAETRVVHPLGAGRWAVRNGPFMRRFLDGYYPMHVTLRIDTPQGMTLVRHSPDAPSVHLERHPDHVLFDAWFEGELRTELVFER
jgi:hypothetical protein